MTPYQAIEQFRSAHPEYADQKIGYAGRLDPMAEGILLCMLNEGNTTDRDHYLNLDKDYEVTALIGIETDSYDLLGMVQSVSTESVEPGQFKDQCAQLNGKTISQPFPPYSAQPIDGIPLYRRTRLGLPYDPKTTPTKKRTIYSCVYTGSEKMAGAELKANIKERILSVSGDFRQSEILQQWDEILKEYNKTDFILAKATIRCSSGTFIRTLVHDIGKELEVGACVYSLKRTQVGPYEMSDCIQIEAERVGR